MAEMNNSNTDNSYLDDVVVQKQLIDLSTSSEDQSSPANTTSGTSEYNDTSATNNDISSLVSPLKLQGLSLNDYNNADEDVNESLLSSNNVDVNGGLNNGHAEEQNHQVVEEVHHSQKKNDVEAVAPEDNNAQVEQQRDQVPEAEEKGDDVIPQLQHEPPVEQTQAQDLGQNYSAGVVEDGTAEVNVSARSIATDESSEDVQQQQKAGEEAEDSQRVAGSEEEEHEPASPPITLLDLSSTQQPAEEPQNVAQVSDEEETVAATAVAPVVAETARSDATAESLDDAPATAERKNETAAGSSSGGAKAAASKPAKTRACAIL